jgi:tRNA ligase
MAGNDVAPYRPQDRQEVGEMLRGLEEAKGKGKGKGFSCKKNTFPVDGSDFKVDSWKMQDWDYKKPNLPTYARGLFTTRNSKNQPEIVTRGYDKFFNHGEVRETEWRNVEAQTRGPYELSVKENGCIIFISGLEDGTLLV